MSWGYQLSPRSRVSDRTVSRLIGVLFILTILVASPVLAASKESSNSKSKSSSKKSAKTTAKCDRNYEKCVPVASDVDCKPGNGNGPKYLSTSKRVIKKDVYRLDADKDRIACERK